MWFGVGFIIVAIIFTLLVDKHEKAYDRKPKKRTKK